MDASIQWVYYPLTICYAFYLGTDYDWAIVQAIGDPKTEHIYVGIIMID